MVVMVMMVTVTMVTVIMVTIAIVMTPLLTMKMIVTVMVMRVTTEVTVMTVILSCGSSHLNSLTPCFYFSKFYLTSILVMLASVF